MPRVGQKFSLTLFMCMALTGESGHAQAVKASVLLKSHEASLKAQEKTLKEHTEALTNLKKSMNQEAKTLSELKTKVENLSSALDLEDKLNTHGARLGEMQKNWQQTTKNIQALQEMVNSLKTDLKSLKAHSRAHLMGALDSNRAQNRGREMSAAATSVRVHVPRGPRKSVLPAYAGPVSDPAGLRTAIQPGPRHSSVRQQVRAQRQGTGHRSVVQPRPPGPRGVQSIPRVSSGSVAPAPQPSVSPAGEEGADYYDGTSGRASPLPPSQLAPAPSHNGRRTEIRRRYY